MISLITRPSKETQSLSEDAQHSTTRHLPMVFSMSISQSVVFVEALQRKFSLMGWNQGTKQITSFTNRDGKTVDIIKQYGQIDEVTLKAQCENFCKPGGVNAKS
jgi:hypothetical protein